MSINISLNDFKYKTPIPIRFCDMDLFGHANNAIFLTYFEQARSNYWTEIIGWDWDKMGIILAKAEVEFISPVVLTDELFAYFEDRPTTDLEVMGGEMLYASETEKLTPTEEIPKLLERAQEVYGLLVKKVGVGLV